MVQYTSVSHCSLNFECPRLEYGFLSIILVLENAIWVLESPWKVLEFCTLSLRRTLIFNLPSCFLSSEHGIEWYVTPCFTLDILVILQPFNGLFSRTTWVSRYQKGKTNLDFTGANFANFGYNTEIINLLLLFVWCNFCNVKHSDHATCCVNCGRASKLLNVYCTVLYIHFWNAMNSRISTTLPLLMLSPFVLLAFFQWVSPKSYSKLGWMHQKRAIGDNWNRFLHTKCHFLHPVSVVMYHAIRDAILVAIKSWHESA